MNQESPTKVLARITQEAIDAAEKIGRAQPQETVTAVFSAGAVTVGATALAALLGPGPAVSGKFCGRC